MQRNLRYDGLEVRRQLYFHLIIQALKNPSAPVDFGNAHLPRQEVGEVTEPPPPAKLRPVKLRKHRHQHRIPILKCLQHDQGVNDDPFPIASDHVWERHIHGFEQVKIVLHRYKAYSLHLCFADVGGKIGLLEGKNLA